MEKEKQKSSTVQRCGIIGWLKQVGGKLTCMIQQNYRFKHKQILRGNGSPAAKLLCEILITLAKAGT